MKLLSVIFLVLGAIAVAFSGYYGILFGTTDHGPAIQGYAGGLIPTVTAVWGTLAICVGWKHLRLAQDLQAITKQGVSA